MTTATLHDYDELVGNGFSEQQARAMLEVIARQPKSDPEVMDALNLILQRLSQHGGILDQHSAIFDQHSEILRALAQAVGELQEEIKDARVERAEIRLEVQAVNQRVQLEGRVTRMINATLIALGAIGASLLAVFTR